MYYCSSRSSTVQTPLLENLPSDPDVSTWLCWSLVDFDEFQNSWGTQRYPECRKPSLALWAEKKMLQCLLCKKEVNQVQKHFKPNHDILKWEWNFQFLPHVQTLSFVSINELYSKSVLFVVCVSSTQGNSIDCLLVMATHRRNIEVTPQNLLQPQLPLSIFCHKTWLSFEKQIYIKFSLKIIQTWSE